MFEEYEDLHLYGVYKERLLLLRLYRADGVGVKKLLLGDQRCNLYEGSIMNYIDNIRGN